MKSVQATCYGYCRNCWSELTFTLEVKGKTVSQIRQEINGIHLRWGCAVADARLVRITDGTKTIFVQKPTADYSAFSL